MAKNTTAPSSQEAKPPKQKNSFLSSITDKAKDIENRVVASQKLSEVNQVTESPYIPEIPDKPIEKELPEKIVPEVITQTPIQNQVKTQLQEQSPAQFFSIFSKKREKESLVERVVIPTAQRDELKIIATALNLNLQELIANILDNFLEVNQVEIKKAKKKLIEGK